MTSNYKKERGNSQVLENPFSLFAQHLETNTREKMVTKTKPHRQLTWRQVFTDQLKSILPILLTVYAPVILLLAILKLQNKVSFSTVMRDPLAIADYPPYVGAVSNLGILFWCSAAAICLFSFVVLRKLDRNRKFQIFFLGSGCITAILVLDDLYLLHEMVFPEYLNLSENVIMFGYISLILLYLVKFRKIILNSTDFIILFFAFGFFGFSMGFDKVLPVLSFDLLGDETQVLLEDGFKFAGIISWLTYFARTCFKQVKEAIALN